MSDENELDTTVGSFSSRPSPRSFDMLGGASSSVIVRCSWILMRLSSRPVLLAPVSLVRTFLRCLCHACLLSVPCSIVVSFGSPLVRQVGRGVGGFLSRSLRHVACRGWAVSVAGRFSSWVLLVAAVSITSAGGVVPVVPLLAAGHSIGLVCLVRPVACFAIVVVCRHGLIVIGCCRRGSVSSSGVVARRRPACLPSGGGRRHPC